MIKLSAFLFIFGIVFLSQNLCGNREIKNLQELKLKKDINKKYNFIKNSIEQNRVLLKSKNLNYSKISKIFKESLVNRIIPFWEGTKWDFNGYTPIPKKGEIACGYFISTTLQDIGIKVNRYKLAQQNPLNEAKTLAIDFIIIEISEKNTAENIDKIYKILPNGIHFIGFDQSHVGFILNEEGKIYLIHSNYIESEGVIVEISTNKKLLKKWVYDEKIDIIKQNL